jgi:quercetin dioxygenase-like cupin family protein
MSTGVLLDPLAGEVVTDLPERTVTILCAHELLDATWSRYEPGERGPDPHVHRQHVDAFYVLTGELAFGVGPDGSETVRAPAGSFVAVPPDVVHTFGNEGTEAATYLNYHAPSCGFADHLRGDSSRFDSFDPPADGGRPATATVVSLPGESEHTEKATFTRLIKAELGELSAIEFDFGPGWDGIDAHAHADHLDSFFVLDGEVAFIAGSEIVPAGPGAFISAPPGLQHGVDRLISEHAILLNVHAPDAGFVEGLRRA